jgi:hypothetical protein
VDSDDPHIRKGNAAIPFVKGYLSLSAIGAFRNNLESDGILLTTMTLHSSAIPLLDVDRALPTGGVAEKMKDLFPPLSGPGTGLCV